MILEQQNKTGTVTGKAFVEKVSVARDSSLAFPNPRPTCIFGTQEEITCG